MKRFVFVLAAVIAFCQSVNASVLGDNTIQTRVDTVGYRILNANKIQKRMIFVCAKEDKKKELSIDKTLKDRQIVVYDELYRTVQTDDELAAMLSREISTAVKSYSGMWGGRLDSIEVTLGSKKFETVADKRAVDYMVNSGYNPLALIVYIHKTCPQKRSDKIGRHNLTSKRLARIYEYITYKYPTYLYDNEYVNNQYYQNFLLTSVENRKKLEEKIKNNSTKEIDYE